MHHFHNILYVSRGLYDETDGLKQALSLARNNKAPLKVLIMAPALPKNMTAYAEKYETSLVDNLQAAITATAQSLHIAADELNITVERELDQTPAIRIIRYVLRHGHDLVIKEAETRDMRQGLKAMDMDLLRKCPCPVWLCRPIEKSREKMRVAVAIDPQSEEPAAQALSKRMLELSTSLAHYCSGRLHIVSCWDYEFEDHMRYNPWTKISEHDIQDTVQSVRLSHKEALHKVISQADISDHDYKLYHIRGAADLVMPDFVEAEDIDILVMGTVARTGVPGFVMGNTAENILQSVSCSLIALKPEGFVSPVQA